MGLFNRKKDEELPEPTEAEEGPKVDIYTPQMLTKRLLWDMVPCSQVASFLPLMNLVPDSEDVSEMEHRASHERIQRVVPLKDMLDVMTPLVSGITASVMLVNSGIKADEESAIALQRSHAMVVQRALVAVLGNLLEMGIIEYTEGVEFGEQLLG
ncbi:hypothetical protein PV336_16025 [Streptomyces sp. MI02-2A]|uniref:hypothetical protein n=1 Tax=Streptomyces sp. MI02-2A TaxID=3028688 RepID=UPI0029A505EC|nr:hypothetical protein [Streptomyces sp. MI02-2A]MDX3260728.1 hypothetical protein [Streptomyces sp. MI02-2A]